MLVKEEEEAEAKRSVLQLESFRCVVLCWKCEVEVAEVVCRSLVGCQEFALVEMGAFL